MSIDYVVRIEVPTGVLELFGDDPIFSEKFALCTTGYNSKELLTDSYLIEFDNLELAKKCEETLIVLFNDYIINRDKMIEEINRLQLNITQFLTDVNPSQLKELLSLCEVEVSEKLFSFLMESIDH